VLFGGFGVGVFLPLSLLPHRPEAGSVDLGSVSLLSSNLSLHKLNYNVRFEIRLLEDF